MISYSMIVTTLLLCGFLGHANSQGHVPDTDNVYKVVNDWNMHNHKIIGARNSVSNNPDSTALSAVNKMKDFLKLKCDKDGSAGAFDKVNRTMYEVIKECTQNFNDIGQQSEEMERHITRTLTKDQHQVFKKYCRYTPVFKKCASKFTVALEPCLHPQEKDNIKIFEDVADALLDFVCYKDGDNIIQLISAHGSECVNSKQVEMVQCMNTTFGSYLPELTNNHGSLERLDKIPLLVFGRKECKDITTVQSCVVNKLKGCSDPTPANIVDSLFNDILGATPCKEFRTDHNAASTSTINLLTTSIVFLVSRLI